MAEIIATPKKTLAVARVGEAYVLATSGTFPIQDDELFYQSDWILADSNKHGRAKAALQYSLRFAPSAKQRQQLSDRYGEVIDFNRFGLVAASAIVRGAVTALSWVFRGKTETKAFAPGREGECLTWMQGVAQFDMDEAVAALRACVESTGYPPLKI